jgi:hypothetical protein
MPSNRGRYCTYNDAILEVDSEEKVTKTCSYFKMTIP